MDRTLHRSFQVKAHGYLLDFLGSSFPSHIVSGALAIVAGVIVWSMLPHKAVVAAVVPPVAPISQADPVTIAQQVASAHLFGQGAVVASASQANANITVEGVIYSDEQNSALVILKIDGNSNIFRVGDTLPDGEKVLALAPTAVQLGNPGNPRVIQMQEDFGSGGSSLLAGGADFGGREDPFPGMPMAGSLSGLKPVSLPLDADPLTQLRSLRQQLIRQKPPVPAARPAKSPPKP